MAKVIVVGAGIAGIAAAIRLRASGHAVSVYEANAYPGGKLSDFEEASFRFDAGPSLFTMPEFVEELFSLFNEPVAPHFQYEQLAIGCHYFYEDGTQFNSPTNREQFAELLEQQLGEDKNAVRAFFKKAAFLYKITAPVFLENSLHQLSTYLNRKGIRGIANLWRINLFSTMHQVNAKRFKKEKTIQLFNRFATYNGSNPYQAPATLNIIPHLEFGLGVFFPKGGMVSITNSLVDLAKRHGVQFYFNSKVEQILTQENKVKGVLIAGESIAADQVVCNIDVFPAYKYLLPQIEMPEKVKQVNSSSSALVFYWGIKEEFKQLGLHNILFSENYKKEFDAIFKSNTIDSDPTIYINITSKLNPSDAPVGHENWFLMINVPANTGQAWDGLIETARANILNKLNRMLKTDVSELIVYESVLDPRTIEIKTSSYRGALYGSSSNDRMAAFFRHANFTSAVQGLYFCGGSVHPGGGIPLCLLSAKITAALVNKKKGKE
jgi:phytoene desaturase